MFLFWHLLLCLPLLSIIKGERIITLVHLLEV
nr:hypothetical protein YJOPZNRJ_YJOPZNRJ_CDS_0008 [Microvirus sp.]